MANRAFDQTVPLSLMLKEDYSDERSAQEYLSENMSEASSHDSFYDSLSDLQDESIDGTSPQLSAFLSQEEMNKSLDIAREAISGPNNEEQNHGQFLNRSPLSPTDKSFEDLKRNNQASEMSKKKDHRSTVNVINNQRAVTNASSNAVVAEFREKIGPLLTASPSFIRTLQAQKSSKNAGRRGLTKIPNPNTKAKSLHREVGSQNELSNKAVSFIEELSAIFRETSKARDRRPNGDTSSPDSGYLSPKKDQPILIKSPIIENEEETKPERKSVESIPIKDPNETFDKTKNQTTPQEEEEEEEEEYRTVNKLCATVEYMVLMLLKTNLSDPRDFVKVFRVKLVSVSYGIHD
ncbi:hypothetical protein FKM82_001173 [Ascaphus truei]